VSGMRPDLSIITSAKVRNFLAEHPYQGSYFSPLTIQARRMALSDMFYILCEIKRRPPTIDEYVTYFTYAVGEELPRNAYVFNALARAWAGFIRELDFFCILRDSGLFDYVLLDTFLDRKLGYDIIIFMNQRAYFFHIFFSHSRRLEENIMLAEEKATRKHRIRERFHLPEPIEFFTTELDADFIGNVYLFKPKHAVEVLYLLRRNRHSIPAMKFYIAYSKLLHDWKW